MTGVQTCALPISLFELAFTIALVKLSVDEPPDKPLILTAP